MVQYESGSRTSKTDLTNKFAGALGISPLALSVPDIDSYLGLMHTLFTLEDRYGLTIEKGENGVSMHVDSRKGKDAAAAFSEAGWKADGAVSHWSCLDELGSSIPYCHGRSLFDRHDCGLCGRIDYACRVMPHFVSHT